MKHIKLIILTVIILAGAMIVIAFRSQLEHDDGAGHEGHDHATAKIYKANAETDAAGDHQGHGHDDGDTDEQGHDDGDTEDDHNDEQGYEEHEDEHEEGQVIELSKEQINEEGQVIELSKEQIKEIGIALAAATGGKIDGYINLPGEVVVNADRMAHIVPRVSGVVGEVKKKLGDNVKAGEVMAVIRSRDLADAKAGYLAAIERDTWLQLNVTI